MGFDNFLSTRAGVGGLFDDSEQNAMNQFSNNQQLFAGMALPSTEWENYNPQAYQAQMAQANTISEDPMIRSAQLSALQKMSGLADTGLSDVDQANFQQARNDAGKTAQQGVQNALANANARGMAGSGMEFAMRNQANQDAANRQQNAGLQQAATSAQQRALYNQAYGQGLQNLRGQDAQTNAANAGILNQFNMANTQAQNQQGLYNVGNQNQAQQYNQQGRRDMRQQAFGNQMTRAAGMAGANKDMGNAYGAQNAARNTGRKDDAQLFGTIMGSAMGKG